ncbi:MAG TPA: hypothetical protein VF137_12285 [Candidatus Dormibacteraeota bacterium]
MKKFFALVPAAIAALVLGQTAFASTDIYHGAGQGYDISYPQCGIAIPSGAFGIDGVDGSGRPFDVDNQYGPSPCLGKQYAAARATGNGALYMNTGYDPSYVANHPVATCVQQSQAKTSLDAAHQQAWEVGCASAWFNQQYVMSPTTNLVSSGSAAGVSWQRYGQGLPAPTMWWLDVETGNSWSSSDLTLNAETLQGSVDELTSLTPGIQVGAYSTSYQWGVIAGSTHVTGLAADWVATGQTSSRNVKTYCSKTFNGGTAWLVQWVSHRTYDYDVPC